MVFFPTRPAIADVCVVHPLAKSYVRAAAETGGATALEAERKKRVKYGTSGTGACKFYPLAHETYGRVGPAAYQFLNSLADVAASSGTVSKRAFIENSMRRLSTALCRGVARQARASAPLRARLLGGAVVAGESVPTDELPP